SKDGRVQLWNALTGEPAATLQREGRPVLAIAFMPGGETLIAGTATGELLRWKVASNASMPAIGGGAAITCLAARPDAAALAVAGTDGTVRLLDPNTGGTLAELPDATARGADCAPIEVRAIAFSHDGRTLACALADGTMRVWNGTDGTAAGARASGAIGEPGAAITALLADPASDTMITGSADGALRVWSFATTSAGAPAARELAKLDGGVGAIVGLSIDTDARTIACVGSDGRLALLRTQSPVSLAKARDALAAALDARRVTVQDWFAKAGPTGAVAQFDATRAGLDATQVHAVRDLLLRFGPAGSR
ncbi:MAG: WD40 repeat domain-containing protein, partial [Planctomycetota bacterium]